VTATTAQTYRHALVYPCTVTLHPACAMVTATSGALQDTSTCMEHEPCAMCCQWRMDTPHLPSCCGPAQVVDLLAAHCFQASQSSWFGFGAIHCLFGSAMARQRTGSSRDQAHESLLQEKVFPRYNQGFGPADVQHACMNNA